MKELTEEMSLQRQIKETFSRMEKVIQKKEVPFHFQEIGLIKSVGKNIVKANGLPNVKFGEIVHFKKGQLGMVFNLNPESVDIILLDDAKSITSSNEVVRTNQVMSVPVGDRLLGRVIDAVGRPLDGKGAIGNTEIAPIEQDATAIMDRDPVNMPLQTGLLVIDSLIPIGRGQRELILGDRQTGKTAIAIDTILNQKNDDVICIYCAIGRQISSVARVISRLEQSKAMDYSIVMVASGDEAPGMNYIAPYAATSIGEYFMKKGKDVLVIYDDLTQHARAYRELSLLMRRPPAREAFPGDIFYIHSRLLERATHLKKEYGGGSLTALPIVETEAQNLSAYIPTNIISITDGQIYLSPQLFQGGILPAVDVGKSVSRVGGKTQLAAYRKVVGDLRLSYSQFQELEIFSRFGTQLDENTKKALTRGRRIREILKQNQYDPYSVLEQIILLLAVSRGLLDNIPVNRINEFKKNIKDGVKEKFSGITERINNNKILSSDDEDRLTVFIQEKTDLIVEDNDYADAGDDS
ncbi:MAG: alternate F1F0 ATPase, F1 subunit alpha [Atribacterota bacterium]|nr:alternate F1F0 ATPase, F1 subunit alpha [Atribacterota bacterium]